MSFNRQSICLSPSKACDSVRSLGEIKLPDNSFTFEKTRPRQIGWRKLWFIRAITKGIFLKWIDSHSAFIIFKNKNINDIKALVSWHLISALSNRQKIFANLKTTAKLKSLFINAESFVYFLLPPTTQLLTLFLFSETYENVQLEGFPTIPESVKSTF